MSIDKNGRSVWNLVEKVMAIITAICLIIALLLDINAYKSNIESNRNTIESNINSVKPYLIASIYNKDDSESAYLAIENIGNGPAIINTISITYDGNVVKGNPSEVNFWEGFVKNTMKYQACGIEYFTLSQGAAIKNSDDKIVLTTITKCNQKGRKLFLSKLMSMQIEINYCSIRNDCYDYRGRR